MVTCPVCTNQMTSDFRLCEQCGNQLPEQVVDKAVKTLRVEELEEIHPHFTWGTAELKRQASLILEIADTGTPIVVKPQPEIILGRGDLTSPQKLDVDLTLYAATERGVSRRHAALNINNQYVTITDLGSANGTLLNGQQLSPKDPRVVRNGDEIRLGKLKVNIYFAKSV